jgi:hypothetical protein
MWTTINFLKLFSLNLPMKWADLSEKATLHFAFSKRNGVKSKAESFEDKIGMSSYWLLGLINIIYFGTLVGIVFINASYINTFNIIVHSILCFFLMYKFNPMNKNIIVKDYDKVIIFSSALFLLVNLGIVEVVKTIYIDGGSKIIKTIQNHFIDN